MNVLFYILSRLDVPYSPPVAIQPVHHRRLYEPPRLGRNYFYQDDLDLIGTIITESSDFIKHANAILSNKQSLVLYVAPTDTIMALVVICMLYKLPRGTRVMVLDTLNKQMEQQIHDLKFDLKDTNPLTFVRSVASSPNEVDILSAVTMLHSQPAYLVIPRIEYHQVEWTPLFYHMRRFKATKCVVSWSNFNLFLPEDGQIFLDWLSSSSSHPPQTIIWRSSETKQDMTWPWPKWKPGMASGMFMGTETTDLSLLFQSLPSQSVVLVKNKNMVEPLRKQFPHIQIEFLHLFRRRQIREPKHIVIVNRTDDGSRPYFVSLLLELLSSSWHSSNNLLILIQRIDLSRVQLAWNNYQAVLRGGVQSIQSYVSNKEHDPVHVPSSDWMKEQCNHLAERLLTKPCCILLCPSSVNTEDVVVQVAQSILEQEKMSSVAISNLRKGGMNVICDSMKKCSIQDLKEKRIGSFDLFMDLRASASSEMTEDKRQRFVLMPRFVMEPEWTARLSEFYRTHKSTRVLICINDFHMFTFSVLLKLLQCFEIDKVNQANEAIVLWSRDETKTNPDSFVLDTAEQSFMSPSFVSKWNHQTPCSLVFYRGSLQTMLKTVHLSDYEPLVLVGDGEHSVDIKIPWKSIRNWYSQHEEEPLRTKDHHQSIILSRWTNVSPFVLDEIIYFFSHQCIVLVAEDEDEVNASIQYRNRLQQHIASYETIIRDDSHSGDLIGFIRDVHKIE